VKYEKLDFKFLAENISHLVFVVLPDETFGYANSKYVEYTGLTPETASGDGWKVVVHPEDLPDYETRVQSAVQKGGPLQIEARLRRAADSAFRWHLVKAEPLKDENDRTLHWVVTCTDVHDQKQAKEELQAMKDRLELALEDADVAFFDWDFRTRKFTSTESYYHLHGQTGKEAGDPYQLFLESLHPEDRAKIIETIESLLATRKIQYTIEYRTVWPDRSVHWISSWARLIRDENGKPLLLRGVEKDITQAKETEFALEKALRLRDDFLSIASHELKTPLTSIAMQVEVIQKNLFPKRNPIYLETRLENALKLVVRNARRLGLLIEQLLDVARLNSEKLGLNFAEDDLACLVSDMVDQFKDQIEASGSSISLDLPKRAASKFDSIRIEQVVVNLLTNAVKYGQGNPIEISLKKSDPYWVLEITDHGIGISGDHLGSLFERFSRSKLVERISGLGLGLYIARQIVEAHCGTISVRSTPGVGSTFTVKLPV
jgi:PAS domain S-box-containing protein